MSAPRLSVVMPVHDGARWLGATLDSLPAHEPGLELVIRDSTPSGGCEAMIDSYRDRLAIDYAWMPDVPSWTRKTNLCVDAARAPHATILHQDDLWLPGRYDAFTSLLQHNPDVALFLSPAHIVDAAGQTLGTWRMPLEAGRVDAGTLREALLVQNSVAMPAPVFAVAAYRAAGGLDESLWYTPDWNLWLSLAGLGPAYYEAEPRTAFRVHGNSLTMTGDRGEFARDLDTVLERHFSGSDDHARICRASVRVNVLLARASGGDWRAALSALGTVAGLGPRKALRFLRFSRLAERTVPRLRARLAGSL